MDTTYVDRAVIDFGTTTAAGLDAGIPADTLTEGLATEYGLDSDTIAAILDHAYRLLDNPRVVETFHKWPGATEWDGDPF